MLVRHLIRLRQETFFRFSGEETEAWAGVLLIWSQVSGIRPQVSHPGLFPVALLSQAALALPGSSLEHGLSFLDSSRAPFLLPALPLLPGPAIYPSLLFTFEDRDRLGGSLCC